MNSFLRQICCSSGALLGNGEKILANNKLNMTNKHCFVFRFLIQSDYPVTLTVIQKIISIQTLRKAFELVLLIGLR